MRTTLRATVLVLVGLVGQASGQPARAVSEAPGPTAGELDARDNVPDGPFTFTAAVAKQIEDGKITEMRNGREWVDAKNRRHPIFQHIRSVITTAKQEGGTYVMYLRLDHEYTDVPMVPAPVPPPPPPTPPPPTVKQPVVYEGTALGGTFRLTIDFSSGKPVVIGGSLKGGPFDVDNVVNPAPPKAAFQFQTVGTSPAEGSFDNPIPTTPVGELDVHLHFTPKDGQTTLPEPIRVTLYKK